MKGFGENYDDGDECSIQDLRMSMQQKNSNMSANYFTPRDKPTRNGGNSSGLNHILSEDDQDRYESQDKDGLSQQKLSSRAQMLEKIKRLSK